MRPPRSARAKVAHRGERNEGARVDLAPGFISNSFGIHRYVLSFRRVKTVKSGERKIARVE